MSLESIGKDIAFAWRVLVKAPVFTIAVVATLAIAISVNVVGFAAMNTVLFQPLPIPNANNLAFVCNSRPVAPLLDCYDKRRDRITLQNVLHISSVDGVTAFQRGSAVVSQGTSSISVPAAYASSQFFKVLQTTPEIGRLFTKGNGKPGNLDVVISDHLWRTAFNADPKVLGTTVKLDQIPHRIIGVLPADFVFPDPEDSSLRSQTFDIIEAASDNFTTGWPVKAFIASRMHIPIALLARIDASPGGLARAQTQLSAATAALVNFEVALYKKSGYWKESYRPFFTPAFHYIHEWYAQFGNATTLLQISLLATFAILLIACANVGNLLVARGSTRQGEFAIRNVLGATRLRLVQQLTTEMLLLIVASCVIGIALAYFELFALTALNPTLFPRMQNIHIDLSVLVFIVLMALLSAILAGVVPAFLTTRRNLSATLKNAGRGRDGTGGKVLRTSLVIFEIALAFTVLVSAAILTNEFISVLKDPLGFSPDNLCAAGVSLPPAKYGSPQASLAFIDNAEAKIKAIPGVQGVSTVIGRTRSYRSDGTTCIVTKELGCFEAAHVMPNYLQTLHATIVAGRDFSDNDRLGASPAIVMNSDVKSLFGVKIGSHLMVQTGAIKQQGTLVGFTSCNPRFCRWPGTFISMRQFPERRFEIVVRTNAQDPQIRNEIGTALSTIDPQIAVHDFSSIANEISTFEAPSRTSAALIGALAFIALLLSLGGMYAIISYAVERRTHEFGIRKALGAQRRDIWNDVLRVAAIYAVGGIALGFVFTAATLRLVASMLYVTSAFNPAAFAGVVLLVLGSALGAAAIPALRAIRIDPIDALRYE